MLPRLFHISLNDKLPTTLKPQRPEGFEDPEQGVFKEFDHPRVSFSPTIYQCLQAIFPNVWQLFSTPKGQKEGIEFSAYAAKPNQKARVILPERLTKDRLVWDAHITQEHCFLDPVEIYYCGKFIAFVENNDPGLSIHPYNEKSIPARENSLCSDPRFRQTVRFRGDKYRLAFFGAERASNLMDSSELEGEQLKQYKALLKDSKNEEFFYGVAMDPDRPRQVILYEGDVAGAFEYSTSKFEGKSYQRTNKPYILTEFRGKGLMKSALEEWYKDKRPALAWIDDENEASIKLFLSLGFKEWKKGEQHGKSGQYYVLK